ncbi:MAG: FxsA family protein [Rhodothermales bacterium]
MLARLIALFLLVPVIELALLVQVDKLIGFWPTLGLIIITGLLGSFLARREGLSVWKRFNQRLATGGLPGKELLDGVIILMAGALLITPGVLTDVVGFLGLIPVTRAAIRKIVVKRLDTTRSSHPYTFMGFRGSTPGSPSDTPQWQGTARQVPGQGDPE